MPPHFSTAPFSHLSFRAGLERVDFGKFFETIGEILKGLPELLYALFSLFMIIATFLAGVVAIICLIIALVLKVRKTFFSKKQAPEVGIQESAEAQTKEATSSKQPGSLAWFPYKTVIFSTAIVVIYMDSFKWLNIFLVTLITLFLGHWLIHLSFKYYQLRLPNPNQWSIKPLLYTWGFCLFSLFFTINELEGYDWDRIVASTSFFSWAALNMVFVIFVLRLPKKYCL